MSTVTPPPVRSVDQDAADFARRVREALADLGPDQVDDLTDGLEANLVEAMADESRAGATLVDRFGDPEAYASELRAAAGLEAGTTARRREPLRSRLARAARRRLVRLRATRWWPPVEDLLLALRPVWWVLRGWVLWKVVAAMGGEMTVMPQQLASFVLLLVLVVASSQWGRGRWRLRGRLRHGVTAVSVFAAVAAVPTVLIVWSYGPTYDQTTYVTEVNPSAGVFVGSEPATNLFVYDAQGRRVPDALVYDQDGRPVVLGQQVGDDGTRVSVPWSDESGSVRANAYPWGVTADDQNLTWDSSVQLNVPGDAGVMQDPVWPFQTAVPLRRGAPSDEASTTPSDELSTQPTPSSAATGDASAPAPTEAAPAAP